MSRSSRRAAKAEADRDRLAAELDRARRELEARRAQQQVTAPTPRPGPAKRPARHASVPEHVEVPESEWLDYPDEIKAYLAETCTTAEERTAVVEALRRAERLWAEDEPAEVDPAERPLPGTPRRERIAA